MLITWFSVRLCVQLRDHLRPHVRPLGSQTEHRLSGQHWAHPHSENFREKPHSSAWDAAPSRPDPAVSTQLAARALSLTCKGAEGAREASGSDLIPPVDPPAPGGETCPEAVGESWQRALAALASGLSYWRQSCLGQRCRVGLRSHPSLRVSGEPSPAEEGARCPAHACCSLPTAIIIPITLS